MPKLISILNNLYLANFCTKELQTVIVTIKNHRKKKRRLKHSTDKGQSDNAKTSNNKCGK